MPPLGQVEDDPREKHRYENTHRDAEHERDAEALHAVRRDLVNHHAGDEVRHVRVDNGRGGAVEAVADRHPQRGAPLLEVSKRSSCSLDLLLDSLRRPLLLAGVPLQRPRIALGSPRGLADASEEQRRADEKD